MSSGARGQFGCCVAPTIRCAAAVIHDRRLLPPRVPPQKPVPHGLEPAGTELKLKKQMVRRMMGPPGESATALAKEVGVSQTHLVTLLGP